MFSAEVTRTAAWWVARLRSFGPLGTKHMVESLWRQIAGSDSRASVMLVDSGEKTG